MDNLSFGEAVEALKKGFKVCKKGWKSGMYLYLDTNSLNSAPKMYIESMEAEFDWHPCILELLQDDWKIIEQEYKNTATK